ncbi:MAG TPA: Wzz/FepE/Etk N-terminal domain-containing protein, partial [Novosphingobium sp.]
MTDPAGESGLLTADGTRVHYSVGRSTLLPDPRQVVDILRRRIGVFLLVAAVIMGTAVAYAKLAPRWYEATARVLIEPRKGDVVTQPGTDDERSRGSDFIDTQILIADSPQLARATAQALGLDNIPAFGGTSPSADERLETAGQAVRDLTAIRRVGATSLIEVVATTRSPQLSARLANELVAQYLKQIATGEAQKDQLTNQQIDSKLGQLRTDAEKADAALLQYKIANGLMSAQGATMAEQETSTLNQQIAQARATLAEREGRLAAARRQLEQGGGGGDVTSALNSGTIGSLRAQEAESSRNLAQ